MLLWPDDHHDGSVVRGALPGGGNGLPSFSDRIASIPEFLPGEAGGALPHESRDDAEDHASQSSATGRQRTLRR